MGNAGVERVQATDLARFLVTMLRGQGVPAADARLVADVLVDADLRGVHSHGVALFPGYLRRVQAGTVAARPDVRTVVDHGPVGVLDGGNGLGPVVATRGMALAIEKARHFGVGAVGVRNGNHFGAAGYYAALAAAQGMIGLATSNAAAIMAPPGGLTPVVGNNPIAIAIPTGQEPAIVVDLALSVVSFNKIRQFASQGEQLPVGWALDRQGRPTTDPQAALEGLLVPIAGHKGFGLAIVTEVLTAVLTDGLFAWDIRDRQHHGMGFFFLVLRVAPFIPLDAFRARTDELVRRIVASERLPGVERIYAPGMRSAESRWSLTERGIPIDRLPWPALEQLAVKTGTPLPARLKD